MLLNTDPPVHNRLRKTISHLFTPRSLGALAPMIEETTGSLVREARERGEFDLVEDVTDRLALSTLAGVLGVPQSDQRLFFDWANRIIGYQDAEYAAMSDGAVDPRSPAALSDMHEYALELREYRLRNPGDDVISALAHARVDGEPISDEEFKNFFFLFAVAGNDTTRSALPGGVLALLEHPEQRALLQADPGLADSATEECLRYAPPVILFRRTATRDTVLRGAEMRAGDKVVVFYPAANRDPEEFPDPDVFDITRSPNRHVSFGYGPHVCVAAALARMQLRSMFTAVVENMPTLALRGPVERLQSNLVAGIKRMPVSLGRA
jgi:cytochrome P450